MTSSLDAKLTIPITTPPRYAISTLAGQTPMSDYLRVGRHPLPEGVPEGRGVYMDRCVQA